VSLVQQQYYLKFASQLKTNLKTWCPVILSGSCDLKYNDEGVENFLAFFLLFYVILLENRLSDHSVSGFEFAGFLNIMGVGLSLPPIDVISPPEGKVKVLDFDKVIQLYTDVLRQYAQQIEE